VGGEGSLMALLEVSDVHVRFGGVAAVDGVSLAVHAGEIVGLIGPNGAGKTVTFNVITGLQRPGAGSVHLGGHDVTGWAPHHRAALGLGRTFQVVQLFAGMTVVENLMVAAHRFTRSGVVADGLMLPRRRRALAEAGERARAVLDFLGLSDLAGRDVAGLPLGQARLVELARALCLRPRVLLLDEPASGLDVGETRRLVELLAHVRSTVGCAMLLVEHDMTVVMPLCDHVYAVDHGRPLADGAPAEVRTHPAVLDAYLGATP
jgi:branched-chain amino acid transport system ATP-binding protein